MVADRGHAVGHIKAGDHHVRLVGLAEGRQPHQGVQQRPGIGQSGGLDDHIAEMRNLAQRPLQQQVPERHRQIFANGAADAAIAQFDDIVLDLLDNQMVQGHFAELVDDDGRILQPVIAQGLGDQRRLAAAQEAGDDTDGNPFQEPVSPRIRSITPSGGASGGTRP